MNTKALWSGAILVTVAAFFSACGDGDSTKIKICNSKQVTCLNDQGGEVCSSDGTEILSFQCGSGQHCCDPKVKGSDCGADVTHATCVGDCTPGTFDCGSTAVSLKCSDDGRRWVASDCPVGTGCDDAKASTTSGQCVPSDGDGVIVCNEGDATCADETTAKTCEQDGSNWVYTACAANEMCDKGACVVDPAKGCVPHTGTCEDKTHVKTCNDDGDGYDKTTKCPGGTSCEDGACQGPVCPVGAIRCDDVRVGAGFAESIAIGSYRPRSVYSCNADGTAWEISTCAASEMCVYENISANTVNAYVQELLASFRGDATSGSAPVLEIPPNSQASCQTPECAAPFALRGLIPGQPNATAGSFTCGDGRNPGDDPLGSFSLCEGLPPFNNLYWANYACTAPEQCVYEGAPSTTESSQYIVGPTCASACVPNTKACFSDGNGSLGAASTIGESTVKCGDDGKWDYATAEKCWSDDKTRELWCGPNLQGTRDNYNIGTCMEPACAVWFSNYDTFALPENVGACGTDGKFYPCKPDGTFGDAQDCSQCQLATDIPQTSTTPATFAGYDPGTCVACTDGAQRCVFSSGQTPYYQVCDTGAWTTKACSSSKLCWDYLDTSTALGSILCGADCAPNTASCGGDDGKQIAVCDENGKQGDFKDCKTGACHTDNQAADPGGSGAAYCEAECIQGTFQCTTVADPDNAGTLGPAAISCSSKGRYDVLTPKLCDYLNAQSPERCLDKIGCTECDPGTFSGRPEVRCAVDENGLPADPPAVQVCKNGHWDDAIACPGSGTTCSAGACASTGPLPGDGGSGGQGNGTSGGGQGGVQL